ncbi:MAG: putative Histidine kinase [Pedosphaera sp.]|nr:putative Histidine kinase [Pedosphaera sp.]
MKSDVVFGLEKAVWPAFLVDAAGMIRHANPAALQALGQTLEAGTSPLSTIWGADNEVSSEQFLVKAEQPSAPAMLLKLRDANGANMVFQACVCPVTNEGQNYSLIQLLPGSASSETKAPGLDAGMAHKQKLDCALQLARTVALDFNNALTTILGHSSLVLSKMEANNPWRKSLVEVEKSAAKAAEIANDLAAFSRQEKEVKVQTAGNVNVLLQRNMELLQNSKLDKEIEWALQLERKLFAAKFDEAKMQQAILKILENAVESLGNRGRISLQSKNLELTQATQDRNAQLAAGAYVCMEITDNGSGIEPEVLPRIFEPFFTTKRGGTHRGLGLAWVYGIVTNHGGGVAVSSQPGVGTSVRIYLPADKRFVNDSSIATDDLTGKETILMVDDEDLLLTMGQTVLSAYGYQVLTANSGQKAIEILSKNDVNIDLVITDLVMPGMSGRELVEHVHRLAPFTPILCSSGYVRPTSQEQDNQIAYLQKPFTSQELLMKVKHTLMASEAAPVD